MNRKINKIAVIGSGVMGSGIACHFANIGIEVLLLDITPTKLNENEKELGLSLDDKKVKNRIVNEMFQKCVKSKPAQLYHKNFSKLHPVFLKIHLSKLIIIHLSENLMK